MRGYPKSGSGEKQKKKGIQEGRTDERSREAATEEGDHVDGELGTVGLVCVRVKAPACELTVTLGRPVRLRADSIRSRAQRPTGARGRGKLTEWRRVVDDVCSTCSTRSQRQDRRRSEASRDGGGN